MRVYCAKIRAKVQQKYHFTKLFDSKRGFLMLFCNFKGRFDIKMNTDSDPIGTKYLKMSLKNDVHVIDAIVVKIGFF